MDNKPPNPTQTKPRAYFFGCVSVAGHYMFDSPNEFGHMAQTWKCASPWADGDIDKRDGPQPPGKQVEGPARLHHLDGWTMLSFWDRSVDKRGGCNGNFILEGEYDFDAALALVSEIFPGIIGRLANPLTQWVLTA